MVTFQEATRQWPGPQGLTMDVAPCRTDRCLHPQLLAPAVRPTDNIRNCHPWLRGAPGRNTGNSWGGQPRRKRFVFFVFFFIHIFLIRHSRHDLGVGQREKHSP